MTKCSSSTTTLSPARQSIALTMMFSAPLVAYRKASSSSSAPKSRLKRVRALAMASRPTDVLRLFIFSSAYAWRALRTGTGIGPTEAVLRYASSRVTGKLPRTPSGSSFERPGMCRRPSGTDGRSSAVDSAVSPRVIGSAASPAAADLPRKRRRFSDFMDSSRCRCRRTMMSKADPSVAVRRGPDPSLPPGTLSSES